jgi:hypothetical protein
VEARRASDLFRVGKRASLVLPISLTVTRGQRATGFVRQSDSCQRAPNPSDRDLRRCSVEAHLARCRPPFPASPMRGFAAENAR